MQLTDLLSTVASNWSFFEPYLPAKDVWDGKLREVTQIRNRIAHFRIGHRHDAARIEQFLRDVDVGFWQFCTSYNSEWPVLPATNDPVAASLVHLDPFPWTQTEPGKWARFGIADPNLLVSVSFNVLRRPWLSSQPTNEIAGKLGYLYDATLGARNHREFDYSRFFTATQDLHSRVCHICLDSFAKTIRITVPSILGATAAIEIFQRFVAAGENALRPGSSRGPVTDALANVTYPDAVDRVAEPFPEYVLGPSNPLTFLDADMPCSFFNVD